MSDLAQLERRLKDLESNRGASFRFAEVASVDEKTGTARVKLPDGEGLVSMPLRVSQRRTLKDQSQELPDVGEQVACLFTGQGFEQGVIFGAVYSKPDASPGRPSHSWYLKFEDGTEVEYDRKGHSLTLTVKGDIKIKTDGPVSLEAPLVDIKADIQVTGNIEVTGSINASGSIIDGAGNTNHHSHP